MLARSTKVLEGDGMPQSEKPAAESVRVPQNGLVYDLDWNEEERLSECVHADLRDVLEG